ncbi:MAG: hypothetical protein HFJ58_03405 [Clostridia bacterium]|nr:hypothetical protein [Clostridia bacterium]
MISAIIQGIFNFIIIFFDTLLSPVVNALLALFPDLLVYFTHINTFLDYMLEYVALCRNLLFIPHTAIILLLDYFTIKYTIYLTALAVKFGITIYNKLKP